MLLSRIEGLKLLKPEIWKAKCVGLAFEFAEHRPNLGHDSISFDFAEGAALAVVDIRKHWKHEVRWLTPHTHIESTTIAPTNNSFALDQLGRT